MLTDSFKPLRGMSCEEERVSLDRLSQLTGFPKDFIKKELLLDDDILSLSLLRERAVRYLDGIYGEEGQSVETDKVPFENSTS